MKKKEIECEELIQKISDILEGNNNKRLLIV